MAEITKGIAKKDKGDLGNFNLKSPSVAPTVQISNEFIADARGLAELYDVLKRIDGLFI